MAPLYYASLCGFRGLVEAFLVAHPQDITAKGGFHDTPLYAACARGHLELVKLLLQNSANPSLCDNDNTAPLHSASRYGRVDVMKMLLDCNDSQEEWMVPITFVVANRTCRSCGVPC